MVDQGSKSDLELYCAAITNESGELNMTLRFFNADKGELIIAASFQVEQNGFNNCSTKVNDLFYNPKMCNYRGQFGWSICFASTSGPCPRVAIRYAEPHPSQQHDGEYECIANDSHSGTTVHMLLKPFARSTTSLIFIILPTLLFFP